MQISSFVNNQDPLSLTGLLKKQLRTPPRTGKELQEESGVVVVRMDGVTGRLLCPHHKISIRRL